MPWKSCASAPSRSRPTGYASYEEQYQPVARPGSQLLHRAQVHRPPVREWPATARRSAEARGWLYVQPDFYYEPRIWVFCDGTPHDEPVRSGRDDKAKRQAIMATGDEVWVYYYKDNLAAKVAARPDIFRKVK
jgi:hypothetical protein